MKNNLNDIGDAIRRIEKLEKAVFGLQKKGTKPRNAVATDTLASKLLSSTHPQIGEQEAGGKVIRLRSRKCA